MRLQRRVRDAARGKLPQARAQRVGRVDPLDVGADRRMHVAALQPEAAVHVDRRIVDARGRDDRRRRKPEAGRLHESPEADRGTCSAPPGGC